MEMCSRKQLHLLACLLLKFLRFLLTLLQVYPCTSCMGHCHSSCVLPFYMPLGNLDGWVCPTCKQVRKMHKA